MKLIVWRHVAALVVLAVVGACDGDGVCRGVCETVLVVEYRFDASSPWTMVEVCDGDHCLATELSLGECHEPPPGDDREFFLCYDSSGVFATRRFFYERHELPVQNFAISLRVVDADGLVLLDEQNTPELTDNDSCIGSCPRRSLTF